LKNLITAAALAVLFLVPFSARNGECRPALHAKKVSGEVRFANRAEVCMVTDRVPGDRAMFPVRVKGKTYYGCCPVCIGRLKNERAVRYAIDPVTGREVDKATAFIVSGPEKRALYFESEESARKFLALSSTEKKIQ